MKTRSLILIGIHVALGYVISMNKEVSFYIALLILTIGPVDILFSRNKGGRAGLWAAYFVGIEVLLRMTSTAVFWEIGKYGVILLLVTGLVSIGGIRNSTWIYVGFFLLLLPSILMVDFPTLETARQQLSFNLSGPLSLALAAIYFYQRRVSPNELTGIFSMMLLPLVSMLTYIVVASPDLESLRFSTQSNYAASGGFGPNQVSTMLGLGCLLTGVSAFYRLKLSGSFAVDILLFVGFTFRGLVTFSRGGLVAALLALGVILTFYFLFSRKGRGWLAYGLFFLLIISGVSYAVWDYANEATNKMLTYRYLGVNPVNRQEEDITSRRWEILQSEWGMFMQSPVLGVGPGMGKLYGGAMVKGANSHSELTRLLAEHGLFGLTAALILLTVPVHWFRRLDSNAVKPLLIGLFILALLTMSHSAVRLAMPGFLYGLALILPSMNSSPKIVRSEV